MSGRTGAPERARNAAAQSLDRLGDLRENCYVPIEYTMNARTRAHTDTRAVAIAHPGHVHPGRMEMAHRQRHKPQWEWNKPRWKWNKPRWEWDEPQWKWKWNRKGVAWRADIGYGRSGSSKEGGGGHSN